MKTISKKYPFWIQHNTVTLMPEVEARGVPTSKTHHALHPYVKRYERIAINRVEIQTRGL